MDFDVRGRKSGPKIPTGIVDINGKPIASKSKDNIFIGARDTSTGQTITRLMLRETKVYHDQYNRPYESAMEADTPTIIANHLEGIHLSAPMGKSSVTSPTAGIIGGLANRVIRAKADVRKEDRVAIANGWNSARFVFILEVESTIMGVTEKQIITGFTDRLDYNASRRGNGHIDLPPDLSFYINNVISVKIDNIHVNSGYNGIGGRKLDGINQLVYNNPFETGYKGRDEGTITPYDVLSFVQLSHTDGEIDLPDRNFRSPSNTTRNVSSMKFSRRSNTHAADYVGRMLGSMQSGIRNLHNGTADELTVWEHIKQGAVEDRIRTNRFFSILRDSTDFEKGKCVTFDDLLAISPDLDNIVEVFTADDEDRRHQRNNLDTEYWDGATLECQLATTIKNSLPALLSACFLEFISIEVHNYTSDGSFICVIDPDHDKAPIAVSDGVDEIQQAQIFQDRLEAEVLNNLTEVPLPISLIFDASLMSETFIEISVDNHPHVPFANPSFADNLSSPVMSRSGGMDNIREIANDMELIFSEIDVVDHNHVPNHNRSFQY